MAYDAARAGPAGADQDAARRTSCRRAAGTAPEGWEPGDADHARDHARPGAVQRGAARWTTRSSTTTVDKKRLSAIVNDLAERYPKVQVAATLDALKEAGFHWATRSGVTISIEDVVTPPSKAEILERYEAQGREGPEPVRARSDHRRRAPSGAHRDLDPGDQRGRRGDGGELPEDQPGLDDGQLRRPRKHDAGPADRRHAWSGRQPEGRDHPAPDQVQLPRGPVRAGVLHLHPRRPQGSGRHRAADRRLGLPHPSSGRRLAGRHHPRGGLRHRARPAAIADRGAERRRHAASRPTNVETSVYARTLAEDVVVGRRDVWPRPARDLGDVAASTRWSTRGVERGPGPLAS